MLEYLRSGVFYTIVGKYSNVVIQLIVNAVLSRLLTPQQYGVVGVVQVFLLFFTTIVDAGLGPALIQNKTLNEHDNRALFNFSIFFSLGLAFIFAVLSPLIAWFYHDDIYIPISIVMAFTLFFQGLNMIPNAMLDKAKRFKEVNLRLVISNVVGGIVGVATAYAGWGVYALILSFTIPAVMAFVLNMIILRIKPLGHFDKISLAKVWDFAKNQFAFNFVNYFSRNIDKILVGKLMGADALGNYQKSYQLLLMPNQVLLGVINPVLLPVLSDYQDNVHFVRKVYLKIVHLLALMGVPLSVFLTFESHDVIFFLFGDQWGQAVLPFTVLALTVWIQMTVSSTGAIFQTMGKTRYLFINGCVTALLLVGSIVIGVMLGSINTVAVSLSIGFLLNFIVIFVMLMKFTLEGSMLELVHEFISPAILGAMLAVAFAVSKIFIHIQSAFVSLMVYVAIALVVAIPYLILSKEYKFLISLFKK